MTALCGGGASQPHAWVPPLFLVPAGAAANYIGNAGGIWASLIAAAIGVKTYSAATNCTTDPPGWPATPTVNEALALVQYDIGSADWLSGLAKVNQMLDNVLWYLLCECTGAATPPQPAFPAPPTGLPTPGVTTLAPSSRLCVSLNTPVCGAFGDGETSLGAVDLSHQLLPFVGAQSVVSDIRGFNTVEYVTPSPLPLLARATIDGTPGCVQILNFWSDSTGPLGTIGTLSVATTTSLGGIYHRDSGLISLPASAHWAITAGQQNGCAAPQLATLCVETYGPSAGGGVTCCPPDPSVTALLRQILGVVTPMQRYKQPFAFVTSTAHAGLSGTGTVAIPRSLGVDVLVTASPPGLATLGGNPSYLLDLGWVSVSETGGMLQERRVSQQHFAWLPEYMALADHFNYFLNPGVTITMTELHAEA